MVRNPNSEFLIPNLILDSQPLLQPRTRSRVTLTSVFFSSFSLATTPPSTAGNSSTNAMLMIVARWTWRSGAGRAASRDRSVCNDDVLVAVDDGKVSLSFEKKWLIAPSSTVKPLADARRDAFELPAGASPLLFARQRADAGCGCADRSILPSAVEPPGSIGLSR